MNNRFYGIFIVKFHLNLFFKKLPKFFSIKFSYNAPEIGTLQKIKNSEAPELKYQ